MMDFRCETWCHIQGEDAQVGITVGGAPLLRGTITSNACGKITSIHVVTYGVQNICKWGRTRSHNINSEVRGFVGHTKLSRVIWTKPNCREWQKDLSTGNWKMNLGGSRQGNSHGENDPNDTSRHNNELSVFCHYMRKMLLCFWAVLCKHWCNAKQ